MAGTRPRSRPTSPSAALLRMLGLIRGPGAIVVRSGPTHRWPIRDGYGHQGGLLGDRDGALAGIRKGMSDADFHSDREERTEHGDEAYRRPAELSPCGVAQMGRRQPGTARRGLGRLTGLREVMSALALIMSALPPGPDILVAVTDFRF